MFFFHQVSREYDPLSCWECDWIQTERFKERILEFKKKFTFISIEDARQKLRKDFFRFRRYAVLTADDGYQSVLNVLPWLEEQKIPVTLFINSKYLDRQSWSAINEEQARRVKKDVDMLKEVCPRLYLSRDELFSLTSPLISIGLHGHEHLDSAKMTLPEFCNNLNRNIVSLRLHPRYIGYFAYPWGHKSLATDQAVFNMGLVPVYTNGSANFHKGEAINRMYLMQDVKLLF